MNNKNIGGEKVKGKFRAAVLALLGGLILSFSVIGCSLFEDPIDYDQPIRIGLLPIIDSVPFYAAEADGLFEEQGLNVQLETFSSAAERNVALQTGAIDAQLADLIATGLLNNDEHLVQIVKTTYRANDQNGMIALIAGKDSNVKTPSDLVGKEVGISSNSLIEYHLDMYLDDAGINRDDVVKVEVASIPTRMELLSSGQLETAILPEPLTTLAVKFGGTIVIDDQDSRLGLSVLEFKKDFIENHPGLVELIVSIHDESIGNINSDPSNYEHLLSEKARLPEVLQETFRMPPFPVGDIPTEAEITKSNDWLLSKGLIDSARSYEEVVNTRFTQGN